MTLDEFREATKDMPGDADVVIRDDSTYEIRWYDLNDIDYNIKTNKVELQ